MTGWDAVLVDLTIYARLLLSGAMAGLLGWERERSGHAAGLRTHALVGISATLFVSLGIVLVERYANVGNVRTDPVRVIEAVVAGVSFIGAGTIFVSREAGGVRGLTTAASLLGTAAVGTTVGIGRYALAVLTTLSLLFVLSVVRRAEQRIGRRDGNVLPGDVRPGDVPPGDLGPGDARSERADEATR